jgi:hypothetical protein
MSIYYWLEPINQLPLLKEEASALTSADASFTI